VWFSAVNGASDDSTCSIGRITTNGAITIYSLPANVDFINGITAGPGGKLWFTEQKDSSQGVLSARVGWIAPNGKIKTFALPTKAQADGDIGGITIGPNGEVWFLDSLGSGSHRVSLDHGNTLVTPAAIGSITATGKIHMYPFLGIASSGSYAPSGPSDLIDGPGGTLWFFGAVGKNEGIARVSTSGKFESVIPPGGDSMVKLPDGQVWFEQGDTGSLGLAIVRASWSRKTCLAPISTSAITASTRANVETR
jgi:hypothetical protein